MSVTAPGFFDMHVHGGGGASFGRDAEANLVAATWHRSHGTDGLLASLVTLAPDDLLSAVRVLAEMTGAEGIAGIHLEGPWLSPQYAGAHDPRLLREPDLGELERLLDAGGGHIKMVTIAPELPGAISAIEMLSGRGVVAAVGHTNATYEQTQQAISAGATVATHLFNAMRPIHHREPGPIPALLESPDVTIELIADGVHIHPAIYRTVLAAVGPDRIALVTDAMCAAGMPDGAYQLGDLPVTVAGGEARLPNGTIAGSTASMADLHRFAAAQAGTDVATRQTSVNPRRAVGC
ncbi:N-acetylglucosamine-6-phosphate deacetylase [Mycobacteroides abscessus subsp. abscessus]|uniref:N-acetylglucosamine-6-phosphate deacetylase n=1 Tax=Mycobacteroides abscessus TaxID=36809 RepID=UPI00092C432F|nr:N-acetylglucosamine-6-phosphate deacetylase [Mycobacteroides abscessus]AWG48476.1 N-acetylglucosamine-6-phosphate deacetylase [Mycobacteroides abscessus]MDO3096407.1 N-acetylglucosamine-6-phosphate deacetylase [Mycobacteroides abscessus subsp. abscessus]MDO3287150.1 N-acetylglucosamine-6-phosphate deacetylase [Mycobacteroides abscessus subsp. abscessus]MDO3370708.1 N-acetylglucosamine-6-phosphate deacetylase [Mycobacteroides abscessus subsp. abscessus]QSM69940.1 N-acetylglucosamine-6-phosph